MPSRKFKISSDRKIEGCIALDLDLSGQIALPVIEKELVALSLKHKLPPNGGLYHVAVAAVNTAGNTIPAGSQFGGFQIPFSKKEAVIEELKRLGYIIEL